MKLALKITLLYLFISLAVFLVGGIISFQVIKREIDLEQRRFLRERLRSSLKMIERRDLSKPFIRDKISIIPLGTEGQETKGIYSDTLVMHSTLQRLESHVRLDIVKEVNGKYYDISLFDLIVEEDDIADSVQESLLKIYLLLSSAVILISFITSFIILRPFNLTLEAIKSFNLKSNDKLRFKKANTKELSKLHSFLEDMTGRVQQDYRSLKEFTENASHELQTPVAVASGKLELLLEADNLSVEQLEMITSAQNAIKRLSKMGNSLALLTKLENDEFENNENIDLKKSAEDLLFEFNEIFDLKSIKVEKDLADGVTVQMNPTLCEMMLSNLLQNAVRHNQPAGEIKVQLTKDQLTISNTGEAPKVEPALFFERFKKNNQSDDSIGLGLSIVKKIVELSEMSIEYRYFDEKHHITIHL